MVIAIANSKKIDIPEEGTVVINIEETQNDKSVCAIAVGNAPEGTPLFYYFLASKKVDQLRREPDLNRIDETTNHVWPAYRNIPECKVSLIPGEKSDMSTWKNGKAPPSQGTSPRRFTKSLQMRPNKISAQMGATMPASIFLLKNTDIGSKEGRITHRLRSSGNELPPLPLRRKGSAMQWKTIEQQNAEEKLPSFPYSQLNKHRVFPIQF